MGENEVAVRSRVLRTANLLAWYRRYRRRIVRLNILIQPNSVITS
jgi:hypothetical protein